MVTRQSPEGWTVPEPVPFDERFSAIDLFITPDGQRMIFCSNRPLDEMDPAKGDHDFWISTRNEDGWSDPEVFAPAALSAAEDFYPIVTGSGNLYFNSQREGPGTNNIFRSRWGEGGYEPAEKLPAPINTRFREFDAFVSGAEDLILGKSGSKLGG